MIFTILLFSFSYSAFHAFSAELESTTAWEPIRIYFDIDVDNAEKKEIVRKTTDNIAQYLSKLLKVHPCKSINLNKGEFWEDQQLTNYDMYIKIISYSFDVSTIAATGGYADFYNDYRIKAAYIKISPDIITTASGFNDKPRDFFNVLIHEVFHALGVAQGQFDRWIDPNKGVPYYLSGVIPFHYCTFPNISREFSFVSPIQIREFIKERYGDDDFGLDVNGSVCRNGIELEDDGGEGSMWKHPESRVFPGEIMSANHKNGETRYISEVTLTMLKATGWYQVDMSMAEPIVFGTAATNDGEKIKRFMVGPPQTTWPERYQCFAERFGYPKTVLGFGTCYPDLLSTAKCDLMTHNCPESGISDVCKNIEFVDPLHRGVHGKNMYFDYIATPEIERSCDLPFDDDDDSQIPAVAFGSTPGKSSVCQISSLRKRDSGSYPEHLEGRCFHIDCDYDFSSYTVRLYDNSTGVCREKGQKLTFPNSVFKLGYLECTDPYWTCYNRHGFKKPEEVVWPATATPVASQSPTATASFSPSASKSPMATQSPTPMATMTKVPGANDDYINKVFQTSVPNGQINAGSSSVKQISGCQFIDISENEDYFIQVTGDVSFFGNQIENTNYRESAKSPGVFWANYNAGKLKVIECKFVKINGRGNNGNILTVNEKTNMEVIFERCDFIDCSESSARPLVNLRQSGCGSIQFNACTFTFNDPSISCKVVDAKTSIVSFESCRFESCGAQTINVDVSSGAQTTVGAFKFNNNEVRNNNGQLIKAVNVQSEIEFIGNTFADTELTDSHFIYISHNQNKLELKDNLFSNLKSYGEISGGGFASVFPSSSTEFSLTFDNCVFTDIINYHSTNPTFQGGAIQFGFAPNDCNVKTELTISFCKFVRNQALKHGGAVSIQTAGKVYIKNSVFEENKANSDQLKARVLNGNLYDDRVGLGGAIYINPTFKYDDVSYYMERIEIDECNFTRNTAHNGYAIYIAGETSDQVFINFFMDNMFMNNYNSRNSPGNGGVIASEMASKNMEKEYLEEDNKFTNDEFGTKAISFIQVDSSYVSNEPTIEIITPTQTKEITKTNEITPTKEIADTNEITSEQEINPTKEATPVIDITKTPTNAATKEVTDAATEKPADVVTKAPTDAPAVVTPTEAPIHDSFPVIDDSDSYQASQSSITLKTDGFLDGDEEKTVSNNAADIVLIKCNSEHVTLQVSSEKGTVTNKYVSANQPNTVIEIPQTEFDQSEIGLHANSKNPTVKVRATTIPLNIYVNEESTVTFDTITSSRLLSSSSSSSLSVGDVTSIEGVLRLNVSPQMSRVVFKRIDFFKSGNIASSSVETAVRNLNLAKDSTATISNVEIIDDLYIGSNSQLTFSERATFDANSKVTLNDLSFIDLGDSVVNGVCQSIKLTSTASKQQQLNEEKNLICGKNFNCNEWIDKFVGNDVFGLAKCASNEKSQQCLVAYGEEDEGGGSGKGKSKTTLIIVVVCVVVVVAVAVVVVVVVVVKKKKRNQQTSDFFDTPAAAINDDNFEI